MTQQVDGRSGRDDSWRNMRWSDFAARRPQLAAEGRRLLYQYGVGLAFLATTRRDGGPRVHPVCPLLTQSDLFAFLVASPKRRDLRRDARYALHSFPADQNEDAFYVTGRAMPVIDEVTVDILANQFASERGMSAPPADLASWELFAFQIESCLLTITSGHGDPAARHTVWHERSD